MKIGIDVGGSHIGIGLLNNENIILKKSEIEIEKVGIEEYNILNYIDKKIEEIKKEYKIDLIGIAVPGSINGNCTENLYNLRLNKIDFSKLVEKNKNIIVQINNDSKIAGIAEMKYGALKEYRDCVFLCMGTGIGSAVFLNKKLLTCSNGLGFELGHMVIEKNGLKCNCGKNGCFETYCSIKRFKENAKKILNIENISAKNLKDIIEDICINEKSIDYIRNIIEYWKIKDNKTILSEENFIEIIFLIEQYINDMVIGLSNIIDIFEPEAICLGGSFVYFKKIFYDKLKSKIAKCKKFNNTNKTKLVLAELGNDAGIIGATII